MAPRVKVKGKADVKPPTRSSRRPIPGVSVPARTRGGPETKYTKETVKLLCDALADGMYRRQACVIAGIHDSTFKTWLGLHPGFADVVEEAEAKAEREALRAVRSGATNWQSRAWWLERKFRDRWHPPPRDVLADPAPPEGDREIRVTIKTKGGADITAKG